MSYSENQYLKLLKDIYTYGQDSGDRTGTGMRSLFGEKMEFDLREGFPLITTKKMFTRGVFGELLWFLSGSTSNAELENKYNISFWKEWANEANELPNIYGKQWVRWEQSKKIVKVKRIIKEVNDVITIKINNEAMVDNKKDKLNLLGNVFKSKNHGEFKVIDYINTYNKEINPKGGKLYSVQFVKTGYIKHNISSYYIKKGKIEDPYYPIVCGVGYLGKYYDETSSEIINHLKNIWRKMLDRCYNSQHIHFKDYGGKNIFVDSRWFNFENFVEDVQKIPNWQLKKNNLKSYNLDKDYYGSNCYSKETCVWLPIDENNTYINSKPFYYTDKNGVKTIFISKVDCAKVLNIDNRRVCDILNGKNVPKKYDNIKLEYIQYDNSEYVYRYALPFNQIQYIIDEIKNNPTSRRILFTGWNAPEMQWEDTALPCCHSTVVQFYVEDGYLNLYHHQRSADMFLGVPVNIASYATLLMMVSQQTGLKAGKMIHSIGVAHIYHNHFKQVEEQLTRQPYELPHLIIKRKPESIFEYDLNDFEVVGYKHHPLIKGDVAI